MGAEGEGVPGRWEDVKAVWEGDGHKNLELQVLWQVRHVLYTQKIPKVLLLPHQASGYMLSVKADA